MYLFKEIVITITHQITMKIDLHGYTIHTAWQHFNTRITQASLNGLKSCEVVTGQGAIMQEFPTWAHNHSRVRSCVQHKYNPGSFTIYFVKKVDKR